MRTLIPNLEKNYRIASTAFQQTLGKRMKYMSATSKKHETNPFIIEGICSPFYLSSKKSFMPNAEVTVLDCLILPE
ncbi:hypothetical protein [Allocoleopsis franciscana]|uniref:Uncharacterized protein n=1 Tax=Allocoleopsis franciscana PCC 7113 TaxID=1173027 RepID=K9WAQ6_9CYAN|nr:hypothetical protein [Allocoleopsis franciscana]AFZ17318.1 hypothetical protein Mic7113_1440 [Allocoleopsis franciscana PCC 7113]